MKKLFVLLLAFAIVGAVSAQMTPKIAFSGTANLYDQDGNQSWTNRSGSFGWSVTEKDGLAGASYTISGTFGDATSAPLYNSGWKAWYYLFDKMVKVTAGHASWSDYQTTTYQDGDTGYPGTVNRVIVQAYPMAGLDVGFSVPFTATASSAIDQYMQTDLGFKYTLEGIGVLKAYADLNLVTDPTTNVIGAGFAFTGVENLNVIAALKLATNTDIWVSADYTMDKLVGYVEFGVSMPPSPATLTWIAYAGAEYAVSDALNVAFDASFDSDSAYDAGVTATYTLKSNLSIGVNAGYDGALYYSVPFKFKASY